MVLSGEVDVRPLLEQQQRISRYSLWVLVLLCLLMFLDGYDMQVLGYVAPALVKSWHLQKAQLGPVFGFAMAGTFVGGAILSNLGDRIGRKVLIVGGALVFGAFTLLCCFVTNLQSLMVLRVIACVGLGAAVPNAISLATEGAPWRNRATYIGIIYVGYTGGGAIGGFIAGLLIPHFGWKSVFYVGGLVPLAVALLLCVCLPESVRFLALKGNRPDKVRSILQRIRPDVRFSQDARFICTEEKRAGLPVKHLFTNHRAPMTVLLWLGGIASMLTLHFLTSWLPTVMESAGVPLSHAVTATGLFQVGAGIGCFFAGRLIDRYSPRIVVLWLLLAGPFIFTFGLLATKSEAILMPMILLAGIWLVGGLTGLNSMAGICYPTFVRSTSTGWFNGVGRIGSISGPVIGGILIGMNLPLPKLFLCAGICPLFGALMLFLLIRYRQRTPSLLQPGEYVARPAAELATVTGR